MPGTGQRAIRSSIQRAVNPFRRLFLGLLVAAIAMPVAEANPIASAPLPKPKPPAGLIGKPADSKTVRAGLGLSGTSGWLLVDLATGKVVDSHRASETFAPASVAKLPTAAFALDALGPDHRFVTELVATGPQIGNRIEGDLVLRGGGNPELDTDALLPLAQRLAQTGIQHIAGRFIVDGTALPQMPEIEATQSEDASYNPSVSGLNLNFNRVHVKWDARKGRESLSVEAAAERLSPQVDLVRVAVAQTPGGPLFQLDQRDGREEWQMATRAFRGRAARWLPVKRPDLYAGEVFRTIAEEQQILLPAPVKGTGDAMGTPIARHESRALGRILRTMLRYSTNLTAEVAGMAASAAIGAPPEELADSGNIMNIWAASVAGFPPGDPGFRFVNHSGLTTESRVSPERMVDLLVAFARRDPAGAARHKVLPGAIAGYLKPYNVARKDVDLDYKRLHVAAKTGTMSYVRGLAGYIATPGGRQFAFAIFSNDLARRGSGAQRVNRNWMGRAKRLERTLIRNWVIAADSPT